MSAQTGEVSARGLFYTLVALLVLGGASLALRFAHIGSFTFLTALGIAVVQAVLSGLFFMELVTEKPTVRFAFATGLALFALMLSLVVADVITRAIPPLQNPPGTAARYHG